MLALLLAVLLLAGLIALAVFAFPRWSRRLGLGLIAVLLVLGLGFVALRLSFDRQFNQIEVVFADPSPSCDSGLELLITNGSGRDLLYLAGDILGYEPGYSQAKVKPGLYNDLRLESDLIVAAGETARLCRPTLPWRLVKESIMARQETVDPAAYDWQIVNLRLCLLGTGLERMLGFGTSLVDANSGAVLDIRATCRQP